MRLVCALSALLLLSACGSTSPQSLWDDVTTIPKGYDDIQEPAPAKVVRTEPDEKYTPVSGTKAAEIYRSPYNN